MLNLVRIRPARFSHLILGVLLALSAGLTARAQSTNIEFPTPVLTNEVSGIIEPRDIGDPRLTRHFYLLTGTPGDLYLSIESNNLNGDVDLFTAGSLRPLTKLSIFSGVSTTSTAKSVYLRRSEPLILRVEGRSIGDEPGDYRIRFSGAFEPIAEAATVPEGIEPTVTTHSKGKNTRRVNAAGARIKEEEPVAEATVPPPEPAPEPTVEEKKPETETKAATEPEPTEPKPAKKPRAVRAKPARRNTRKKPTTSAKKAEEPAPVVAPETTPVPAEPAPNPRLIIETRDGMRVERYMSEVRRVTVERGQLIVVTNDGKVERRPMATVLRMTIEP